MFERISPATGSRPSWRSRLAELAFDARRRIGRLRLHETRAGRFVVPLLDGGPPSDEAPVVLVHGFSDTKDSFVDVARLLTGSRRVILPDLPGFSDASQPVDHHYDLPGISEVLYEALRAYGLGPVHLVGNSLGGAVVAHLALEHPQWVRSLCLVGSAGVAMPIPSALQRHIEAGYNPFVIRSADEYGPFVRMVVERMPPGATLVQSLMAERFFARRAMNQKILDELLEGDFDLTERLPELDVPTMILWGDRDRLVDLSAGRVFHRGIRDSRLVVMHGIGHCPQVESPRGTARRIVENIARAEERA
ncbi:MAG: alpha/beta hydrolase [Myxococcota bacterium]